MSVYTRSNLPASAGKSLSSLHKNERVRLTSKVKTFLKNQQITIKVDGKEVGIWHLSSNWDWEKHSIFIDTDENRSDVSVIEFTFSEVKTSEGKDPRRKNEPNTKNGLWWRYRPRL